MKLSRIAMLLPFVLLSCGDDPDTPEMNAGTISFDIADIHPQESSTRAAILYLDSLKKTGFRVNAYSTGATEWQTAGNAAKPEFMYDRPVTWDNGVWVCTPAKYWPGKVDGVNYGKVSFFAWNDLKGVTVSGKDETGPPRLTYAVPNTCTAQEDLVTAVLTDKTKVDGNIKFTFDHALSRIGFTAGLKKPYPGAEIKITSLKVTYAAGAVESTGVYTFGDTGQSAGTWAFPASGNTYMSDVNNGGDEVMTGSVTPDNTSTVRLNSEDRYLMLLPQTVAGGAVRMDVGWTVNDGTTLTHRQTIGLPGQVWLPGKHYDYNITVSLTGITLDPVVVNPWGNDENFNLPCTITYKINDGTGDGIMEQGTTNAAYLLAENMFIRPHYSFDGWNTQADGSGDRYEPGDMLICSGDMTLYARWISDGRANCYMIVPGDAVKFKVSQPYTSETGDITDRLHTDQTADYTQGFGAEILWADAPVIDGDIDITGNGRDAVVTVRAKSGVSGNAVVKIYKAADGTKTPVWSYHIWVTDYNPNDPASTHTNTYNTFNNGRHFVFMDRNLGATFAGTGSGLGTGLFYQWGRKDPFPATDSPEATQPGGGKFTITTNSPIVGTINYTIQHPGEFIYCTSPDWNHNDWYWGSYNNELWGHSGDKTIYDPCPAGWRVPVNSSMTKDTSPWSGFTENNGGTFDQGYSWGVNAAYPASGIRNSDESSPGEVEGISVISVLYSASPSLNYLYKSSTVYMSSYVVFLLAYTVRADGLSVRCVQE